MATNIPKRRKKYRITTKNTTVIVETCRGQPDRVTLESTVDAILEVRCKGGNPPVSPAFREEMNKAWDERCAIAERRLREAGILGKLKGE